MSKWRGREIVLSGPGHTHIYTMLNTLKKQSCFLGSLCPKCRTYTFLLHHLSWRGLPVKPIWLCTNNNQPILGLEQCCILFCIRSSGDVFLLSIFSTVRRPECWLGDILPVFTSSCLRDSPTPHLGYAFWAARQGRVRNLHLNPVPAPPDTGRFLILLCVGVSCWY